MILGNIYHAQQRHAMAQKALNESINRLSKEDDVSFLLEGYNNLCEVLDASGNYPHLKIIANKWKNSIDAYKKKAEAKGYTPSLGGRYLKCYVFLGIVAFETGEMDEASKYLSLAEEMAEGRSAMSKYKLRQAQSRFLEKQGKYSEALACADENYLTLISSGDSVSVLPVLESRARLTLLMGNPNKSVELYRQLMMMKDRLRDGELARQTDELNNIYKVDQYRLENEKYQLQLLFLVGGCLLLLILLGVLYYHNRTIKRKNIALITRLRMQERLEEMVKSIESARSIDTLNNNEQIFRQIEQLFEDKSLFMNPKLGREEIAERLGTNRTYIANAIRTCTKENYTISEYINYRRVEYARYLLEFRQDISVKAVCEACGFNTRSNFYSVFRSIYGIAPGDFRRMILKQEKYK